MKLSAVIEAWLLLWACRTGLWFAPFPRVLAGVQFCARHGRSGRGLTPEQMVRTIRRALPYSYHASCLTQALAGWIMLTRRGAPCRVSIGVASQDGFKAHAWLDTEGSVILGDDFEDGIGLDDFHIIWTLPRD